MESFRTQSAIKSKFLLKSNLSECLELTAGLSMSLPKLNLTKLKYLKVWFKCKSERKKKKKQTKILLYHKSSSFLKVQIKFNFVFRSLAETYAVILNNRPTISNNRTFYISTTRHSSSPIWHDFVSTKWNYSGKFF